MIHHTASRRGEGNLRWREAKVDANKHQRYDILVGKDLSPRLSCLTNCFILRKYEGNKKHTPGARTPRPSLAYSILSRDETHTDLDHERKRHTDDIRLRAGWRVKRVDACRLAPRKQKSQQPISDLCACRFKFLVFLLATTLPGLHQVSGWTPSKTPLGWAPTSAATGPAAAVNEKATVGAWVDTFHVK